MNDLSELIADCSAMMDAKEPNYGVLARARELKDLGFDYLGAKMRDSVLLTEKLECIKKAGYIVITDAKIKAFLDRKAKEYNEAVVKKHGPKKAEITPVEMMDQFIFNGSEGPSTISWTDSSSINNWWTQAANAMFRPTPGTNSSGGDLYALTNDFLSPSAERVSGFRWKEERIEEYKAIPPDHALKALKSARDKEIFHYFTIASVSQMKDPLLLGRLDGCDDRFFLAQWGEDVALDDVI